MKVGFIGTGSMGSILIESLIHSGAVESSDMIVNNRTRDKAAHLEQKYPGLVAAFSNREVIYHSDLIFICVKPLEFKSVIDEICKVVKPEQMIVSITSPVLIKRLEEHLPCKIAKVIPSITNYERSGASLCMYWERMTDEDQEQLELILGHISTPLRISEDFTRVTSDISSCGPAFLCFFLEQFVEAAVQETGIPREKATQLASEMLVGTGKLLTTGGFTPQSLQQSVS